MDSEHTLRKALADPACRGSLKAAIRAFIDCDPCDAANDAEWLAEMFRQRLTEMQHMQALEVLEHHGQPGGAQMS